MSSVNNKIHNQKVIQDIIHGNKKVMNENIRKEQERESMVLLDGIVHIEKKTAITEKDAEKKFQDVLNYYK